jgi:hypothetical protein
MSRLSSTYGSLDVLQPYRHPWPHTRIVLRLIYSLTQLPDGLGAQLARSFQRVPMEKRLGHDNYHSSASNAKVENVKTLLSVLYVFCAWCLVN